MAESKLHRFARKNPVGATALAVGGFAILAIADTVLREHKSAKSMLPSKPKPVYVPTPILNPLVSSVSNPVRAWRNSQNPLLSAYGYGLPDNYVPSNNAISQVNQVIYPPDW